MEGAMTGGGALGFAFAFDVSFTFILAARRNLSQNTQDKGK
jgi:hypothetical protein